MCVVAVWVSGGLLQMFNVCTATCKAMDEVREQLGVDIATIPLEIAATVTVSTSAPVLAIFARQVGDARAVAKGSAS